MVAINPTRDEYIRGLKAADANNDDIQGLLRLRAIMMINPGFLQLTLGVSRSIMTVTTIAVMIDMSRHLAELVTLTLEQRLSTPTGPSC